MLLAVGIDAERDEHHVVESAEFDSRVSVKGIIAAPGNALIVMTGIGRLTLQAFPY